MPPVFVPVAGKDECETCRFWFAQSGMGKCHRRAPSYDVAVTSTHAAWPTTMRDNWCGDYERQYADELGNLLGRR